MSPLLSLGSLSFLSICLLLLNQPLLAESSLPEKDVSKQPVAFMTLRDKTGAQLAKNYFGEARDQLR